MRPRTKLLNRLQHQWVILLFYLLMNIYWIQIISVLDLSPSVWVANVIPSNYNGMDVPGNLWLVLSLHTTSNVRLLTSMSEQCEIDWSTSIKLTWTQSVSIDRPSISTCTRSSQCYNFHFGPLVTSYTGCWVPPWFIISEEPAHRGLLFMWGWYYKLPQVTKVTRDRSLRMH